jgi:alkaline phosphatase
MAVGIVTNTEIEDATPPRCGAYRRRAEYDRIVEQFFAASPMSSWAAAANFLPKSAEGSKRKDESDFRRAIPRRRLCRGLDRPEMTSLATIPRRQAAGLFTLGNMDGALDRKFLKGGTVGKFPEQPDLDREVGARVEGALPERAGFFLMVESG